MKLKDVINKRIKDLNDITQIQLSDGNWNYDEYMHGLANGMILSLATILDKEPKFKTAPEKWLRKESLQRIARMIIEAKLEKFWIDDNGKIHAFSSTKEHPGALKSIPNKLVSKSLLGAKLSGWVRGGIENNEIYVDYKDNKVSNSAYKTMVDLIYNNMKGKKRIQVNFDNYTPAEFLEKF